ncbi:MAG: hypothetical protein M3295_08420 [Chloroflexota bacterium]|nr:hypothetical protein [Chloroflexota bacterium]
MGDPTKPRGLDHAKPDRLAESQRAAQRARRAIQAAGGLITPREIADEWGVTQQAISDRIARGTMPPPLKVAGRVRLYLRADLEPYRDATTPAGAATSAAFKARRKTGSGSAAGAAPWPGTPRSSS